MALSLTQVKSGSSQLFKDTINNNSDTLVSYISTASDSIEAKISANSASITSLQNIVGTSSSSGLQNSVALNTANITTINNTIGSDSTANTVKGRIKALETTVNTASTGLTARVTTLEGRMPVAHSTESSATTIPVVCYKSNKMYYDNNNQVALYYPANSNSPVLMGAAWNDYAENRACDNYYLPGTVLREYGSGKLGESDVRLGKCPYVVSDTYGMVIGPKGGIYRPVAVSGRVLVFVDNKDKLHIGDVLCAGPYGMAYKMHRLEVILFPDRILGVVSEIPDYKEWNGVQINDRVWIDLK